MNPRQTRFAKEYAVDHNATQAAIRAGYSPKTAGQHANRLLKNVQIQKAIQSADNQTTQRIELTQVTVLNGLLDIAKNEDNTTSARVRAFELLGKHQGMFGDRIEVTQMPSEELVREWIDALTEDVTTNR